MRRPHLLPPLALVLVLTLTGCALATDDTPDGRGRPGKAGKAHQPDKAGDHDRGRNRKPARASQGTALAALATLPVKGRAPMTGYDRDQFGTEWSDSVGEFTWSRNGCDTRNDALARDLQREVVESNGCVVTSGVLAYEPYTGVRNYYFDAHDNDYATDLDVDHLVSLGGAWATGAQQLSEQQRAELANDPLNLLLTNPSENRSKGDGDAATWLPPNKAFRCSYVARQIHVKTTYVGLWVTAPEKAAMERVLATCPNEPLVQPNPQAGYKASDPAQQASEQATPQPADSTGGSVYYENCDAARADGAAPVRRGDPGYGSHLDGDGDGSACE